MKALIVVQARTGSTRLPGKVLLPLGNASLLEQCLLRISAATLGAGLVVATTNDPSDDPIASLAQALRVACFRGHPTDLLDRHYQAARLAGGRDAFDTVVKIPSDCPLIDPRVIDNVLRIHGETHADYTSNLHPASYPDGQDVEAMTFEALETAHREAVQPFEREHTTPFLWERPERFRIANAPWEAQVDFSMTHRLTVDYPEDYELVRAVFLALHAPTGSPFSIQDVVSFLEAHPDVHAINQRYAGVNWYRHHLGELRTIKATETRTLPSESAERENRV